MEAYKKFRRSFLHPAEKEDSRFSMRVNCLFFFLGPSRILFCFGMRIESLWSLYATISPLDINMETGGKPVPFPVEAPGKGQLRAGHPMVSAGYSHQQPAIQEAGSGMGQIFLLDW